ncbi:hypothetical protein [Helicobacter pylori]|uniref:hypothetical protein n=1 Tax=Helicobacter pylori TaxID=210 RepID=UPI00040C42A4|nr:hypothetical protein [Helicobacter pylori]
MENDVKEELELEKQKLELEKQKVELEKQKQEKQKLEQEKQEPESKEQEKQRKRKKSSRMFWGQLLFYLSSILASNSLRIANPVRRQKQTNQKNSLSMLKKFYLPIL